MFTGFRKLIYGAVCSYRRMYSISPSLSSLQTMQKKNLLCVFFDFFLEYQQGII